MLRFSAFVGARESESSAAFAMTGLEVERERLSAGPPTGLTYDLWDGTEVGRILRKKKTLLERGLPFEDMLKEIDALRGNGGENEKAADLFLATRVRGSVHHAVQIENQLELEQLLVRVLRAAALTRALLTTVDAS